MSSAHRSILIAIAVIAVAAGAESAFGLPAPDDLPENVVIRVEEAPGGRGRITIKEFRHALELTAVAKGRPVPRPGENWYGRLKTAAIDSLLEAAWIYGQAEEWGISVTRRQVRRKLIRLKRESFESGAEFRAFLRESHYTRRDVNERVELQLLSTRLQRRVERQIGPNATEAEEQRAFGRFVKEFEVRWRARTVCASGYVTARCSNGPTVV